MFSFFFFPLFIVVHPRNNPIYSSCGCIIHVTFFVMGSLCLVDFNIYSLLVLRREWQLDNICIDLYDIKQKTKLMNAAKTVFSDRRETGIFYSLFLSIGVFNKQYSLCFYSTLAQVFSPWRSRFSSSATSLSLRFKMQEICWQLEKKKIAYINCGRHITIADTVKPKDDISTAYLHWTYKMNEQLF